MKSILIFCAVACHLIAKEPDFAYLKAEALPFPSASKAPDAYTSAQLDKMASSFNPKIGSYPPQFKDAKDREVTYGEWARVLVAARQLKENAGDSESMACLLATLYRQGHNMDVTQCGTLAGVTVEDALKKYPDSIPVNFQASYFYLQINPKFAIEGEKVLLRLRRLLNTDQNSEVEKGLFFAYLNEGRNEDAEKQLVHCLILSSNDPMLRQFREGFKKGNVGTKFIK